MRGDLVDACSRTGLGPRVETVRRPFHDSVAVRLQRLAGDILLVA